MKATRLPLQLLTLVMGAILLFTCVGCPWDVDKHEQTIQDKPGAQAPSTDPWNDYIKQRSQDAEKLRQEQLQKQADEGEQLHEWQERQREEDRIQQLENRIRQLENDKDLRK